MPQPRAGHVKRAEEATTNSTTFTRFWNSADFETYGRTSSTGFSTGTSMDPPGVLARYLSGLLKPDRRAGFQLQTALATTAGYGWIYHAPS